MAEGDTAAVGVYPVAERIDADLVADGDHLCREGLASARHHNSTPMTLPGFGPVSATALMAAIGDISRFPSPRHLVGYLGLDPKVVHSGSSPGRHGRI